MVQAGFDAAGESLLPPPQASTKRLETKPNEATRILEFRTMYLVGVWFAAGTLARLCWILRDARALPCRGGRVDAERNPSAIASPMRAKNSTSMDSPNLLMPPRGTYFDATP
jgi:hypothetical protein